MEFVGTPLENHQVCLDKLMEVDSELVKHFPDLTRETIASGACPKDVMELLINTGCRLNCLWAPHAIIGGDKEQALQDFISMGVKAFTDRRTHGLAFGFSVLGIIRLKKEQIERALAIRKTIQADLGKYEEEMKTFEPLLLKTFKTLNKPAFYYLDMMLDDKHSFYLGEQGDADNSIDTRLNFLRKRLDLQWLPNGTTPFLYKLLHLALLYLSDHRLKQARHVIAVTAELMKSVNQDAAIYKKLKEMFFMVETVYLGIVLNLSELQEILEKSPMFAAKRLFNADLKDKFIDFGIPIPDGENLNLPVELVKNKTERKAIYKKLSKHGKLLKKSSLPHIPEIYENIVSCKSNWFTGNPFHGGVY